MNEYEPAVEIGRRAEDEFRRILNHNHVPYEYTDDWYDFDVYGEKVEVKSCMMFIRQGGHYRAGRFDFTNEENRNKQYAKNIWIAMFVRAAGQHIFLGFCAARILNKKRYIEVSRYRDYNLMSLNEWLKVVRR